MRRPLITVEALSKTYRVSEREAGLRAAMLSLVKPEYREVAAVREVSFEIQTGEMVGLIGPNGAGKTTTLKLLCGLLTPTRGSALVGSFTPWKRQPQFLRQISMVLGNKSQLIWDIPALDTFRVLSEIYHIPTADFKRRLDELITLLELQDLLARPVRNLSLGERMKCELAGGLLHGPRVLFLDEPTLGLDVSMQGRLRAFIAEINRRNGATILLTSHYMADVTALCERVILIHHGQTQYDGGLSDLARRLAPFKLIRIDLMDETGYSEGGLPALANLPPGTELIEHKGHQLILRVGRESIAQVTADLLSRLPIVDLAVEDPPIEAVIDRIYQEGNLWNA